MSTELITAIQVLTAQLEINTQKVTQLEQSLRGIQLAPMPNQAEVTVAKQVKRNMTFSRYCNENITTDLTRAHILVEEHSIVRGWMRRYAISHGVESTRPDNPAYHYTKEWLDEHVLKAAYWAAMESL